MSKFDIGSPIWKRVAKKWRKHYHDIDTSAADRLRELLVEMRKLLDAIYAEDIVSSDDLGKVYKKIEKELKA